MNELVQTAIIIGGSGFAAYIGVRVAIAEIKGDIKRLDQTDRQHDLRIARLEKPYFSPEER